MPLIDFVFTMNDIYFRRWSQLKRLLMCMLIYLLELFWWTVNTICAVKWLLLCVTFCLVLKKTVISSLIQESEFLVTCLIGRALW